MTPKEIQAAARAESLRRAAAPKPARPEYDARHEVFAPRVRRNPRLLAHSYIMGSFMRDAIIEEALTDQTHTLHIGIDYWMTPSVTPMKEQYQKICPLTSHYRIYRGHQDMAKRFLLTGDSIGLFFEDDADPNIRDWQVVVNQCINLLLSSPDFAECFYLYGREFDPKRFESVAHVEGRSVLQLKPDDTATEDSPGGRHHVFGCLAYLLTRAGAEKIVNTPWEGIPIDVILPDRLKFKLLSPSPFNHNRKQGSLTYPSSVKPVAAQTRQAQRAANIHRAINRGPRVVH